VAPLVRRLCPGMVWHPAMGEPRWSTPNGWPPRSWDRLVPSFQVVERHWTTIAASPDQVWAALSRVTTGELRVFRVLMGVRVLPGRLVRSPRARFDADEPLLGWAVRFGFTILGKDSRRELVFGAIGQPWRLAGGRGVAVAGGHDFAAFDQAGYAKVAANLRLDPSPAAALPG
jgi:hypothetical protein